MSTISEAAYGLNGITIQRFIDGALSEPMAYRIFANTILPGGMSVDRLQSYNMLSPMEIVTGETDTDEIEPQLGYQVNLSAEERGATLPITKTKFENARADRDNLVGGLLFSLGQLGGITFDYIFDRWLAEYCFDGITTGLGVSGGDGEPFFSDSHLRFTDDTLGNDNLLGTENFGATAFANALIMLNKQRDLKGNLIRASKDLALVFGPSLMVRVQEFLGSAGKPFENSNTINIANNYSVTSYMCPRLNADESKEFFWGLYDRRAMSAPNGSGLNMKIMRFPGIFPAKSINGLTFYYTNTMRAGIGSGTATFGVGAKGTA